MTKLAALNSMVMAQSFRRQELAARLPSSKDRLLTF